MNKGQSLAGGIGIGLVLMYVLDPDRGRTRRAVARNKVIHTAARADRAVGITARDMSHRLEGVVARLRSPGGQVADDILALRIRSRIGRYVSHPHAIAIAVSNGRVALSGPILEDEIVGILRAVRATPGVMDVESRMEAHRWAEDVPALQGGAPRRGLRPDILQDRWSPTTRVLVGLAGAALVTRALLRRGVGAALPAAAGATLISRAVSNQPVLRALGIGAGRRLVDFQKTFEIDAPISEVWQFFKDAEDHPRVMAHVLEVRNLGNQHYHWVVPGPLGLDLEYDALLVREEAEHLLEWESLPGAEIGIIESVRLDPTPAGGTRIDIKLSYHPPFGLLGHAVAWLTGTDPHHALNEDMARVKSFLEEGKTTVRGKEITREQLTAHKVPVQAGQPGATQEPREDSAQAPAAATGNEVATEALEE